MQIDPNISASYIKEVAVPASPAQRFSRSEALAAFHDAEALNQSLQEQDEVRDAKVEKALNLIGQVQWPPAETIRRIANLLAMKINHSND